jgi:membrane protein DedA with SNARE-associated domain
MSMEILRYGHDTYGETIINGVSWDLLPVAFWAGVAVILGHLIWRAVGRRNGRSRGGMAR